MSDYLSIALNPVLSNNYGQNVLGSTYNSVEFIYGPPGPIKCQIKQPFAATCNINPVGTVPYALQILEIRQSCPPKEVVVPPQPSPAPPVPPGPQC
jgi:hypothetical protein